jgi:hypothetical protein
MSGVAPLKAGIAETTVRSADVGIPFGVLRLYVF